MTPQLIVIALAPAIGMLWFFSRFNPAEPEAGYGKLLALLFVLGMATGLPALLLNLMVEKHTSLWSGSPIISNRLLYWWVGIGLNEELVKLLPLFLVLYFRKNFTAPYQGLLGGAAVGLGFAAVENIFYLDRYGTGTLLIRSVLTVPAHAFFTIPAGVCLAYSKRAASTLGVYGWLIGGLLAAMTLHGMYNIWLSLDDEWLSRIAYLQVVLMGGMVLILMRITRQAQWKHAPESSASPPLTSARHDNL